MAGSVRLRNAATIALKDYLGLAEEESLLVICDEDLREIGIILYESGKKLCREAIYLEMKQREFNGQEPPEPIAQMMQQVDAVICPTSKSLTHTKARRDASKLGVRVATMPGITVSTMVRCMNADHEQIVELTQKVAERLNKVKQVKIESVIGTNVTFPIAKRKILSSTGVLRNIGESGNLPSGEVYLAPWEEKTNGTVVFDGSIAGIGLLKNPVRVIIKNGFIDKIEGKTEAKDFEELLNKVGSNDAKAVAEFGIGTNYKAKLTGDILEDEKVLGTVHMAFGNNMSMGGIISVQSHIDGLIKEPTVYFDDEIVMKSGKLLF
jgi:leucyl aminopeptidase (aminopeptidase T)